MIEKEEKGLKAKQVSLWGKIAAGTLLIVFFILYAIGFFKCSVDDILKVCGALAVIVSGTIDGNIFTDKITGKNKKQGATSEQDND